MNATPPILEADSLVVERGGRRVLDGVSFSVAKGEVFALLGGNGAGKSTTLLTFLGFVLPKSGDARVLNHSALTQALDVRRASAYLPESATLYPHLSARENLDYFLSLAGVSASSEEVDRALDEVGLATSARAETMSTYSKGMRQKVAIALAILRQTPVLLLDEPTSGLDPVAIDEFNALVNRLADSGTTVLMVTHDVYGACQVARRVGLLRRGHLVGLFEARDSQPVSADEVHRMFAESHRDE